MKMEEQRYRLQFQHFADTTSYSVPKQLPPTSPFALFFMLSMLSDSCNWPGAARVQKSGGLPQ